MSTSLFPYLFQGIYNWFDHNNLDAHLVIDAREQYVVVPQEYINKDDTIVLAIHPRAIQNLEYSDTCVTFDARFKGKDQRIVLPYASMLEIYSPILGLRLNLLMWFQAISVGFGMKPDGFPIPHSDIEFDSFMNNLGFGFGNIGEIDDDDDEDQSFDAESDDEEEYHASRKKPSVSFSVTDEEAAPKRARSPRAKSVQQKKESVQHEKPTFSFVSED